MKILHYISAFSLPSETFIYDLINNLEDHGLDNYVLTHNREIEDERPFSKVKIISEKVSLIKRVYFKLFGVWKIRNDKDVIKYIKELQPDIIHAHFGPNGVRIFNLLQKYNIDIPLVISFHGMDINVLPAKNKKYLDYLLKINLSNNVLFTTPSIFLKNKMLTLGFDAGAINVIPNAYSKIFENTKKNNFWQYGDELKLLNIGRFEEVKGQVYLIEAFSKVLDIYPKSKLTLIGYGNLEENLKKLCKDLKVDEKVVFLKQVEHSKLPNIIVSHDIYIHPSVIGSDGAEESLSVSTIEAQVCGLPSIVSEIGGLVEVVINNSTGTYVNPKSINDLIKGIEFYINHTDIIKKHAINAVLNAKDNFHRKKIFSKISKVYNKFK